MLNYIQIYNLFLMQEFNTRNSFIIKALGNGVRET